MFYWHSGAETCRLYSNRSVSSCIGPGGLDFDPTVHFTGKRNEPFSVCAHVSTMYVSRFWTCWCRITGLRMTVWTEQKLVCLGGEKKKKKTGIVGFLCTFTELWVALLLGKLHNVLWCQNNKRKKVDLSEFILITRPRADSWLLCCLIIAAVRSLRESSERLPGSGIRNRPIV